MMPETYIGIPVKDNSILKWIRDVHVCVKRVDFCIAYEVVAVFKYLLTCTVVAAECGDVGFGGVFAGISNTGRVCTWIQHNRRDFIAPVHWSPCHVERIKMLKSSPSLVASQLTLKYY